MSLRPRPAKPTILIAAILALLGACVFASSGDRLPAFIQCKSECIASHCSPSDLSQPLGAPLPLHLRLLLWDCPSECDYACQRKISSHLREHNWPLQQFHGKWPFLRLAGIQEPCSVLFSLLNFHGHYRGIQHVHHRIPDSYALKPFYILLGIFGMNAWVWSSIFHTRDFLFTERADYFSAGASVLYGLYNVGLRVADIHKRNQAAIRPYILVWTGLCAGAFLAHVSYLSFVSFSYSYNMAANVTVGVLQNILWIYYSVTRSREGKRGWWVWTPVFIVVYVSFAMSLEIFDFFPIADALDAHALWHAATVPMTYIFYDFILKDTEYEIQHSTVYREKL